MLGCSAFINNEPFDSAAWKNGDERSRGQMVYDLQNGKTLIGKSKSEVIEILGHGEDYPNGETYYVDTRVPWDQRFTVHFDGDGERVISTDIGD